LTSTSLIGYRLVESGPVNLSLFTILGTRIQTLVQGYQAAGIHRISLKGAGLAPGIYVYRLKTESGTLSRTMQVVH
ncbi:MAG: T9SS type A sorting domain-containing protein, partial [Candidatus Delongbacteria bacterium]|nr:T9SS type A sorting domain-containing protein [Candidatus Delongbacteria bacterium]